MQIFGKFPHVLYPTDTGSKLTVHKTFRGRLLNVF